MALRLRSAGPCCASKSLTSDSNCAWVICTFPTLRTTRSLAGVLFTDAGVGVVDGVEEPELAADCACPAATKTPASKK
jgi:hypothetical protein